MDSCIMEIEKTAQVARNLSDLIKEYTSLIHDVKIYKTFGYKNLQEVAYKELISFCRKTKFFLPPMEDIK